ncbi:hypothetical protein NIIDNTM18_53190 [Mycolicibacterium litorale]|uniref:Uncharacterized protein n=1 Tax=Mycolicibacterium litorale TaxID=758802 RepID=A0A6S6PE96_9MYCO|nr:hypothetical protein [Mycolicibacterium litorale]BCI56041.1 hypothetical protein NIIDNTM18_53190 [Mycolicibacterium litorale]
MSDNEFVPSEAAVAAAFDFAELTVPPDRLAEHYEIYSSTLALIRKASVPDLGETVPAIGFNARWQ